MKQAYSMNNSVDKNSNPFSNFVDQDIKNIVVIPYSFENTIKYFSYKLRR